MIKEYILGLGIIGLFILILIILFVPLIITIVVGVTLANYLGLTGFVWWCFVILFYLVISTILSVRTNNNIQ